jgi:leucyl-tRNA synthetase
MQTTRDWYREVTADVGMHADLVKYWVRASVLLVTPVAPHFAEHIWTTVLKEPASVQLALWPEPASPVDRSAVEAGAYMRGTVKTIRDAELALLKKAGKGKGGPAPFDPKKPRAVRVYVASTFPEWQDKCVAIVKEAYAEEAGRVDDAKVRELLAKQGLNRDKRAMPFIQAFKVCPRATSLLVASLMHQRNAWPRSGRRLRSSGHCSSTSRRSSRSSCHT